MKYKRQISDLQNLYENNRLIPFIGSGLSYPFNIPTWGNFIIEIAKRNTDQVTIIEPVTNLVGQGEYDFALEFLMRMAKLDDRDIQEDIKSILIDFIKHPETSEMHNYLDLAEMNFQSIITTNYDGLLHEFLKSKNFMPQNLNSTSISAHELTNEKILKKIWHLHGNMYDTGTIVMTSNKYKDLYSQEKYRRLFSLLSGTNTFLMIGFSFDDPYIRNLFEEYQKDFVAKHYIILNNPDDTTIMELKEKYRIEVLSYKAEKNEDHAIEISKILKDIQKKKNKSIKSSTEDTYYLEEPSEREEEIEESLFYKKVKIEDIDNLTLELSKDYFFHADSYIRFLRDRGFSESLIKTILRIVEINYKEQWKGIYLSEKDSQKFIDVMHDTLREVSYGRYNEVIKNCEPLDLEKKGMIHLLADDMKKEIWWGENRDLDE
ncbi:ABC-three component system protein [Priestia megaterium]|uniref:ABC-three component system protein n=1 Tax=Priestia megaterium TaxID=1404 RepID=UPI0011B69E84|nr:ABC-three component system protein [Priestia megaterium]QDZ88636.1 SIR2 family protein [Priestia megaterium]